MSLILRILIGLTGIDFLLNKGNRPIVVHKSPSPNFKEQLFTIGEISVHDMPESVFSIGRNFAAHQKPTNAKFSRL
jgi:hypothetical protein